MRKSYCISIVAVLFFSLSLVAQDKTAMRKQHFNITNGQPAIKGYDPVAYFLQQKAVKGKKELAVIFQGVVYYFSSEANRDAFKKNPAPFEPQYGGWCAYAMGETGEKVSINPETFKLINGKLFLFYNQYFTNTLTKWNKDELALHGRADANWTKIYH